MIYHTVLGTPAEITAYAGQCLLQRGDTGQAIVLLDEGIALFDESFARDRQAYLTHWPVLVLDRVSSVTSTTLLPEAWKRLI